MSASELGSSKNGSSGRMENKEGKEDGENEIE